jgi:hypothetical protein
VTVSVGTQAEPCDDRHKRLRRIGKEENIDTSQWVQGLRISENEVDPENGHILGEHIGKYE